MNSITRKSDLSSELETCITIFNKSGLNSLIDQVHTGLLQAKVKFPLLEAAAKELYGLIPDEQQLPFCDEIEKFQTIGGNVLIGIILQLRLESHIEESFAKAAHYISNSEEWYVSDIIGERVFGYALLNWPDAVLPFIREYANHENNMVVRSTGAGMHYAIKKGLDKAFAKPVFELLLGKASITDYQAKRGIGWAAKTMAKFHPEIVTSYQNRIESKETGQWFRTKVRIGLARNSHAKRN